MINNHGHGYFHLQSLCQLPVFYNKSLTRNSLLQELRANRGLHNALPVHTYKARHLPTCVLARVAKIGPHETHRNFRRSAQRRGYQRYCGRFFACVGQLNHHHALVWEAGHAERGPMRIGPLRRGNCHRQLSGVGRRTKDLAVRPLSPTLACHTNQRGHARSRFGQVLSLGCR